MFRHKAIIIPLCLLSIVLTFAATSATAKDKEYEAILRHFQANYQAQKVKIPFMWLARLAVGIIKPAGVKSFSLTMFENLKFSQSTLDEEMQLAMRNSLSPDWFPILRVRSRVEEQVYMYIREDGKNVKVMLVTIDKNEAAVIKATFNPEKLVEFMNNPKIFGISIGENNRRAGKETAEPVKKALPEAKVEH